MKLSGEETAKLILDQNKWILYQREYKFSPGRKWQFDFVIVEHKIALEVEGGVWSFGRHNRAQGYEDDCKKYNAAAIAGWRVLRYTTDMIMQNPQGIIDDIRAIISQEKRS